MASKRREQMASTPVAQAVREARQRRGWSQLELANRAGVSRPTVARLEAGQQVTMTTLGKVATVLELQISVSLKNRSA
ncbi:helix-turn-helix domain-containing protein [Pseudactinotalea sp. Z1748]|uniref:helix-turn-helix domain-containing protein n=1 Tax=Pseudactinotalea sp. Z1748 TaxID=3413027 RepID=UPI003C7B8D93